MVVTAQGSKGSILPNYVRQAKRRTVLIPKLPLSSDRPKPKFSQNRNEPTFRLKIFVTETKILVKLLPKPKHKFSQKHTLIFTHTRTHTLNTQTQPGMSILHLEKFSTFRLKKNFFIILGHETGLKLALLISVSA